MRFKSLLVGFVAAAGLLGVVLAPSYGGDRVTARLLLKHGVTAVKKRKYEEGLAELMKARVEDPLLHEATYWIALAYDKRKQKACAVQEYRAFRSMATQQRQSGQLDKNMEKLAKKAVSRLKSLDAGGMEIDAIQEKFADQLCALATSHMENDAPFARRILSIVQRAVPDHGEAKRLVEIVTRRLVPQPAAFDRVTDWTDLVKSRQFGGIRLWRYVDSECAIRINDPEGCVVRTAGGFQNGPAYVYAADMRLDAIPNPQRTCICGLVFAFKDKRGFCALFVKDPGMQDRVALGTIQLQPQRATQITVINMSEWKPGVTLRLAVVAYDKTIQVYLDAKKVIEYEVASAKDLEGEIALQQMNLRATISNYRFGVLGAAR